MKHLVIFFKYPEPGKVKTRLAEAIGKEKATFLYRELTEATVESLTPLAAEGITITLAFEPPEKAEEIKTWLRGPFQYEAQEGSGLGERLTQAIQSVFSREAAPLIVVGTDTPHLTSRDILEAFATLNAHDAVLGPSWDGGYYLIGMNSPEGRLFQDISWSSPFVLQQTLAKLKQLEWSYSLLPLKRDIDLLEDLEFFTASRRNP